MTETKLSPSRRQSGMANLATRLTERADTLARRSTSDELTPAVGEPATVPAGPSDEVPAPAVEQEVSPVHVGPASPCQPRRLCRLCRLTYSRWQTNEGTAGGYRGRSN